MNTLGKGLLIVTLFAAGFSLPSLLQFKPRADFVTDNLGYSTKPCQLVANRCEVDEYQLEIIEGSFKVVEHTTFALYYQGEAVTGDVLVTSDDNQFGTLNSHQRKDGMREVLIPYCGNPIMEIVVIDRARKQALQLPLLYDQ